MKKIILSAFILISFFSFPLVSHASYIIHLKDGGQFITAQYWEENGQIMFLVSGGTMGIDKAEVRKIEKSKAEPDEYSEINESKNASPQVDPTPKKTIKKDAIPPESTAKEDKFDLKPYQPKMKELRDKLDKIYDRISVAMKKKDKPAEEKAREEMRATSSEIKAMTAELQEKNKGELPNNWWLNP